MSGPHGRTARGLFEPAGSPLSGSSRLGIEHSVEVLPFSPPPLARRPGAAYH